MIKIWGRATSSNVQAVMWAIGELGLAHERIDIGHVHGGNDTPEFLAMNPNGKVPVLQDAETAPIWETGAILRYLGARYGGDMFWPADPIARAPIDQWAEWSKINVASLFNVPIFWAVVRTAPSQQDPEALRHALSRLTNKLRIAEARLSGSEYLASDEFTLADIQFGHVLYRYFDIDIARAELPNLRRYYDTLMTRPAFREHVAISYEPLRVNDP